MESATWDDFTYPPLALGSINFFYIDRWRFKTERYEVVRHAEDPTGPRSKEVLAKFGSWNEAIVDAKKRAAEESKWIQVYDTWANRRDPWIFDITKDGRLYRTENDGLHMSKLRDGKWHRI